MTGVETFAEVSTWYYSRKPRPAMAIRQRNIVASMTKLSLGLSMGPPLDARKDYCGGVIAN